MADLTISVDIDAKGTRAGADQAKNAIKDVASEADRARRSVAGVDFKALGDKLKAVGAQMQQFGGQLRNVGTTLSVAVTAPIVAIGAAVLKAGADYETALNTFQAVTKATASEMDRAAQVAKDLGADLSLPATSAKDAALAMNELGKAGLTASQAMDAAKGVLQLAAAGQLDEAKAAQIAANALNSFGLEAKETTRIANLLAAASNSSSAEVTDIADALQQASSVFASAKIPVEDLVTAISELANAGIKGSDAGTSLKQFLLSVEAPTSAAAKTMKQLGIDVFDTAGKLKSLPDIIGQFQSSLAGLTDQEQAGVLQKIFGSDAIRAAQILFNTGTDGFNKMKEQVTAQGAAADLAAAKTKGLAGAWSGFKSQLETIGIQLYEVVKAPLTDFLSQAAKFAGDLANSFGTLSPFLQQAVIAFAALVAALGPALVIIGSVVSAIGTIATALGSIAAAVASAGGITAIAPILAAIGAVIAVVAAHVAALYVAWQTNFGGIRDLTAIVVQAVTEAWTAQMNAIRELTDQVLKEVTAFWKENGDDIMRIVGEISDTIKSVWTAVVQFWKENNETIKAVAGGLWGATREIIVGAVRIIGDVITLFLKVTKGDWEGTWTATKKLLSDVVDAWLGILNNAGIAILNAVKVIFQGIWNLGSWINSQGLQLAINLVEGIANGISGSAHLAIDAAKRLAASLPDWIRTVLNIRSPSKVMYEIGQFVVQGLADGIDENTPKIASAATGMGGTILSSIKELLGGDLKGFIEGTFAVLTDKSKSWGDKLKTILSGIAQNFKQILGRIFSPQGGSSGSSSGGLNLGGLFGGNAGGGIFNLGGNNVPPTGTIDANGNYVVNGNQSKGGLGGLLSGGGLASLAAGGPAALVGLFMSSLTETSPLKGALKGGLVGFLAGLFNRTKLRRKEEGIRNQGMLDALSALRTQFDALINDVRTLRVDPSAAISQGTALGDKVRSDYLAMANSLTDKKTRNIALKDVSRIDALIAEKLAALRSVADVARAAGERDRRLLPEFANGVYISPAFRRYNGMLGGAFTGRDTIPAMLAHGEMVLNPAQMNRVRSAAGYDVFKNAGIPGYATGGVATSQNVGVGGVNVTIMVSQDAEGMWHATAQSDAGQKVIAKVVESKYSNDELKLKRR